MLDLKIKVHMHKSEVDLAGRIAGLSFAPGAALAGSDAKLLKAAAVQALVTEMAARATVLSTCADTELKLSRKGDILWQGHPVGKLQAGDHRFKPRPEVLADDLLPPVLRDEVRQRLQNDVDQQQIDHLVVGNGSRRFGIDDGARCVGQPHHVAHAVVEVQVRAQAADQRIEDPGVVAEPQPFERRIGSELGDLDVVQRVAGEIALEIVWGISWADSREFGF